MALDRQSIEKRDFPIGRRGYEPDAVDEHLAMLADEVDSLRRSAARSSRQDSLASAASEQVRMIVEAAEGSASDIERDAELEAAQIRKDAREASDQARSDAGEQAREHVEEVSNATASMLDRADALEDEFSSLLKSVRSAASRLNRELATLQTTVSDLRGSRSASEDELAYEEPEPEAVEPEPEPDTQAESEQPDDEAQDSTPEGFGANALAPESVDPEPEAEVAEDAEEVDGVPVAPTAVESGDEEGARLIALNMALNGTPREETERYLGDNFQLSDTSTLLDDVYARAGQ